MSQMFKIMEVEAKLFWLLNDCKAAQNAGLIQLWATGCQPPEIPQALGHKKWA